MTLPKTLPTTLATTRPRLPVLWLAVLLATGGCSVLAPRPDPSRFYLLTATETESIGAMPHDAALLLGPTTVSVYLQRPQIATRVPPNRVEYSQVSRWAEPLAANVARVLASNLAALLATDEVYTYPAFPAGETVLQIALQVERLERGPAGEAEIVAQWTIRDPKQGRDLVAKRGVFTEAATAADMDASVQALSRAFGGLSRKIAESVVAVGARTSSR